MRISLLRKKVISHLVNLSRSLSGPHWDILIRKNLICHQVNLTSSLSRLREDTLIQKNLDCHQVNLMYSLLGPHEDILIYEKLSNSFKYFIRWLSKVQNNNIFLKNLCRSLHHRVFTSSSVILRYHNKYDIYTCTIT